MLIRKPSYTLYSTLEDLSATVQTLLHHAGKQKLWLLTGSMGVGKTTLVKAFCTQLGVLDYVTSPTFSIIHEYTNASGEAIYHFDFYRIRHASEAIDLDCIAYFESGSYCFIEWPEKVRNVIPAAYCEICFSVQPRGDRILHVTLVD